jgi:hypothetical protein
MSKRIIATVVADMDDFSAELKVEEWVYKLSPIEQADLMRDLLFDAAEAYEGAVNVLHATFESARATKQ